MSNIARPSLIRIKPESYISTIISGISKNKKSEVTTAIVIIIFIIVVFIALATI